LNYRRFVLLMAILGVLAMALRVSVDTDTWWHLRAGAWIVEHRQILMVDPFSLTRLGQPWVYAGWLAQVMLYAAYSAAGYAGLNLLTAVSVTVAFALLWPALEGRQLQKAAVVLLAAATSAVYWSARPQIFSFVLTAAFVLILENAGRRRKSLWLLVPLMTLWANLHGGFVIGLILIVLYAAGSALEVLLRSRKLPAWRQLVAQADARIWGGTLLGSLVAVGANPQGPKMLLYPFKTVSIGVLQLYIEEWQSPNFHRPEVYPFLLMLLLLIVSLALSTRRKGATELLLIAVFTSMALMAGRNIALFALATAPVLSRHLDSALEPLLQRLPPSKPLNPAVSRRLNWLISVLVLAAVGLKGESPLMLATNQQAVEKFEPVAAVDFLLERRPPGPLFNSYNWGGYILWRAYPTYLSFVDGRTDLFNDQLLNQYLAAWRAEANWSSILDAWGIKVVLIEPEAPLTSALRSAGWRQAYASQRAVILTRPSAP
jgi:hypothetical protein